jgi:hypothetical protein
MGLCVSLTTLSHLHGIFSVKFMTVNDEMGMMWQKGVMVFNINIDISGQF